MASNPPFILLLSEFHKISRLQEVDRHAWYKRNFKLVKKILRFIGIVATSKVGPEKKKPHLPGASQGKVQGAALHSPP